ncbi:MAG: hypothetical protein LJE65_10040 [Desulfobacteraceae bacterium]|nr:hypothetical protein [Desulfobacteraceae bacterium]
MAKQDTLGISSGNRRFNTEHRADIGHRKAAFSEHTTSCSDVMACNGPFTVTPPAARVKREVVMEVCARDHCKGHSGLQGGRGGRGAS